MQKYPQHIKGFADIFVSFSGLKKVSIAEILWIDTFFCFEEDWLYREMLD